MSEGYTIFCCKATGFSAACIFYFYNQFLVQLDGSICLLLAVVILGASMILAALAAEAGLPDGVLNIVHGTHVSFCF